MEDNTLLEEYFARQECAIQHTAEKYGAYCGKIAMNLLAVREDAEECVNDTWLHTWNAIPPQRPSRLRAFLGRICRNLALDRLKNQNAQKRAAVTVLLDELSEAIPSPSDLEAEYDETELARCISRFLHGCDGNARRLFLRRYWYGESVEECAEFCGIPVGTAKSSLHRTRVALKKFLQKEGFC